MKLLAIFILAELLVYVLIVLYFLTIERTTFKDALKFAIEFVLIPRNIFWKD